jgi:hypothetical protein
MEYTESIFITRNNIKLINELGKTNLEEKDFSKHNLSKFSCFFIDSVIFKNGYQADIKACTGDIGDSVWCEMVLFDENGNELSCTDVDETIDGEWEFEYKDDVYTVYVEEITFDDFDWNENAKDFSELQFEIDGKYIVKDFRDWLKRNFPKEYDVLKTLANSEIWGNGFESYVIFNMQKHFGEGIYTDNNTQLIRFNKASCF